MWSNCLVWCVLVRLWGLGFGVDKALDKKKAVDIKSSIWSSLGLKIERIKKLFATRRRPKSHWVIHTWQRRTKTKKERRVLAQEAEGGARSGAGAARWLMIRQTPHTA